LVTARANPRPARVRPERAEETCGALRAAILLACRESCEVSAEKRAPRGLVEVSRVTRCLDQCQDLLLGSRQAPHRTGPQVDAVTDERREAAKAILGQHHLVVLESRLDGDLE